MFERYTERARLAVVEAQTQAMSMKHAYVGTEHLLLGLMVDTDTLAGEVLETLGLTFEGTRAKVLAIVGEGDDESVAQIPFTARARKVLELALREALSMGHNFVGTEHLLLGLVRENEGIAAKVLRDAGAEAEQIRNEIIRRLSGAPRKPAIEITTDHSRRAKAAARVAIALVTVRECSPDDESLAAIAWEIVTDVEEALKPKARR